MRGLVYAGPLVFLRKAQINLAFRSVCTTFEILSKVLTLEKAKIILLFARLIVPLTYGRR